MSNRTGTWSGNARGKVRSTWYQVPDEDIDAAGRDIGALAGVICGRTGDSVERVRERLRFLLMEEEARVHH